MFAELLNAAANAEAAEKAAAARLLMTTQQLQACREENNPYTWMGTPTRQAMWGPDPCQEQMEAVRGATVEHQAAVAAAQISQAPTAQDLSSAPAPQMSSSYDPVGNTDPAIPDSEGVVPDPALNNPWSPMDVDDLMLDLLNRLEADGMEQEEVWIRMRWLLEDLEAALRSTKKWLWDGNAKAKWLKVQFKPKNQRWVGMWQP